MSRNTLDSILLAANEALERSAHAGDERRARRRLARELQQGIEQGVRERLGPGVPRRHRREIRTVATALAVFLAGAAPAGAATSTVRDGTLHVVTDAGEEIRITCSDGAVKVNGADPGSGAASCAEIRGIRITGYGGDDTINLSGVSAEAGFVRDDGIREFESQVVGLDGSDTVIGSAFDDDLDGGAGNDVLSAGSGQNVADGGDGFDLLVEAGDESSASLTLSNTYLVSRDRVTELHGIDTVAIRGGDGHDRMHAQEATLPVDLDGGAGNDSLIGGSGHDRLMGGGDDDLLVGGAGNDTVGGAAGNDTIFGGLGDDGLSSGDGRNEVDGGEGFDVLSEKARDGARVSTSRIEYDPAVALVRGIEQVHLAGGPKNDVIDATETTLDVRLLGAAGNDTLLGGAGNDPLVGGSGEDRLVGGVGNDTITGGSGNDTLIGGFGNDYLDGGSAADMLQGGAGNNTLIGGSGEDVIESGAGDDVTADPGNGRDRKI